MNKTIKLTLLMSTAVLLAGVAHAESRISSVTTASPMSTTARLNFAVNVPRILYLRVGDAGATINTVTFNVGLATSPTVDSMYAGAVPGALTGATATDNSGASDGQIGVQLWTNNGTSSLTCSGAALTSGANTIPLSAITVANGTGGTLAHPGSSLACTTAAVGSAGTNNLSSTWTFAYAPAALPAAGSYTTTVTYTASQP